MGLIKFSKVLIRNLAANCVVHMINIRIYVISRVRPSVLHGKNINVGHYVQTFQPTSFIPKMLNGTIDYHFVPLSVSSTFARVHKVSGKGHLLDSFSRTLLN